MPRRQTELMELLGVTHRTQFRTFHLQPLIDGGLLSHSIPTTGTIPDNATRLRPSASRSLVDNSKLKEPPDDKVEGKIGRDRKICSSKVQAN